MNDPKQEWKDALIDEVVPEVRTGNFSPTLAIPKLRDALIEKADENEPGSYAKDIISDLLHGACKTWIERIKRTTKTNKVAYQMPDGTVARYDNMGVRGFPQRLETGEVLHQQRLWREMNEEQFSLMYRGVVALATAHSMIAAAFRKVVDAFEKFPHASTVEEVCQLANIDPNEIEIQINDVRRLLG
jgi:hypothetical protein